MRRRPEAERGVLAARIETMEALRRDGEANRERYEQELARLEEKVPKDKHGIQVRGYFCAATPASDGERVFAIFSPGLLVCCDLAGRPLWTHAVVNAQGGLAKDSWGNYAEVPMCAPSAGSGQGDGKVLVAWGDQLHCLDTATGKLLWRDSVEGAHCAASPVVGGVAGRRLDRRLRPAPPSFSKPSRKRWP